LVAEIERRYGGAMTCTVVKGGRGIFDVVVDGELVFSKHQRGRFPSNHEITDAIDARRG
jgi:selT/selW/selH-like putative selenoprotein